MMRRALPLLLLLCASPARAGTCYFGLAPTGVRALWLPREAREARARAVAAAQRLRASVRAEVPLAAVLPDLADLLIPDRASITPPPAWRLSSRHGSLAPAAPGGVLRRVADLLVAEFPGGADLAMDLRAFSFHGRLQRLVLSWAGVHPRLDLEMSTPIEVARMGRPSEKGCTTVRLLLDEP